MTEVLPELPDLALLQSEATKLNQADDVDLEAARLAIARRYRFASWTRLELEVERKNMIHHGDVEGLERLLAAHPALVGEPVSSCFENDSILGYLGVARFHGLTDHDRAGEIARVILTAGGSPDGPLGAPEPPLVTAASYGEVDMVRALIEAGADLEATGFVVPEGSALAHAVEFGNVEVVDVLAGAGAGVHDIVEAAGVGELDGFLHADTPLDERARAYRAAAVCQRLDVIDEILATGVPVDADPETGDPRGSRTVLHEAAYWGKPNSVRHLLSLGADPDRRDDEYGATPLGWCKHRLEELSVFGEHLTLGHRGVVAILGPVTTGESGSPAAAL